MEGQFEYIQWLRAQERPGEGVVLGLGDDAAILAPPEGRLIASTDMLVEGTHFLLPDTGAIAIGRKAMAVNVSDIAAMGCRALWALVAAAFRTGLPEGFGSELHRGMSGLAKEFGVSIVGGDTVSTSGPFSICVTILGTDDGLGAVRRSGAREGDWVCVTGSLGGSILGRHMTFTPRQREGLALNRSYHPHAMIDVSDGLAADLGHILDESGVGAVLEASQIPISPDAKLLSARTGSAPLDHALGDGEDFELVFTLSPEDGERLLARQDVGTSVSRVGTIRTRRGLFLRGTDGREAPLAPQGFKHPNVVF